MAITTHFSPETFAHFESNETERKNIATTSTPFGLDQSNLKERKETKIVLIHFFPGLVFKWRCLSFFVSFFIFCCQFKWSIIGSEVLFAVVLWICCQILSKNFLDSFWKLIPRKRKSIKEFWMLKECHQSCEIWIECYRNSVDIRKLLLGVSIRIRWKIWILNGSKSFN